ncbi:hypothetical protein PO124_33510 [Bacillus licheniformis]|nr:hypothetical protein [Bacillus licheniformis]
MFQQHVSVNHSACSNYGIIFYPQRGSCLLRLASHFYLKKPLCQGRPNRRFHPAADMSVLLIMA